MDKLLEELAELLFDAADALRDPEQRQLQNKCLVASWNAQRACGRGPWEVH